MGFALENQNNPEAKQPRKVLQTEIKK